ncbi:Transposase [Methylobacterium gossipiicola]|uniref:Transposase n=1 Tax=Methylobacterium gossipiicola TaxID=582675 RepID=A0A1I2XFF0_9HYPH|nr:Transposase [Methylobacterium gossipiicola]
MKKSRFSEEQIIGILKEQQAGLPVAEICRRHGISDATFYTWRSRYGGMEVSDARRLKALDEENRKLKKLLAEAMLDVATLREALGKTSDDRRTENGRELGYRGEGLFGASCLRADRPGAEDVPLRLNPRRRCGRAATPA